jgi:hypothetical protein
MQLGEYHNMKVYHNLCNGFVQINQTFELSILCCCDILLNNVAERHSMQDINTPQFKGFWCIDMLYICVHFRIKGSIIPPDNVVCVLLNGRNSYTIIYKNNKAYLVPWNLSMYIGPHRWACYIELSPTYQWSNIGSVFHIHYHSSIE